MEKNSPDATVAMRKEGHKTCITRLNKGSMIYFRFSN
jgi:hypothetical protein